MFPGRQSPASTLTSSIMTPTYSQQSSLSSTGGFSRSRSEHRQHASSLVNAMLKFSKNNMINDDLNTLIVQYIAKTGQLPIISDKELTELPKFQFGQHINKMSGFVRSSGDSTASSSSTQSTSSSSGFGIKKPKPIGNALAADSSETESSDDELAITSWKENFMRHFNHDIKEHAQTYKKLTDTIGHYRRVWKAIQTVVEKKLLNTIDEYNRLYGYEHTEKKRCENKNCHYISFTVYRKSIHKRFTTYFEEFPPFSLQRVCELLTLTHETRNSMKLNCGKLMRSLDKNLRVVSYWKPIGIEDLFDDTGKDAPSECGDKTDDEDRGSIFNDTASIHSISKHSWASKSMMSPRSCGSQSPFHPATFDDPELAIIRDIGGAATAECMNRVPSPITTANQIAAGPPVVPVPQVMIGRTPSDEKDSDADMSSQFRLKRQSLEPDQSTTSADHTNPSANLDQQVSSPKKIKSDDDSGALEKPKSTTDSLMEPPKVMISPPEIKITESAPVEQSETAAALIKREEALTEQAKQIVEDIVDSTNMDTGEEESPQKPNGESSEPEPMSQ